MDVRYMYVTEGERRVQNQDRFGDGPQIAMVWSYSTEGGEQLGEVTLITQ